MRQYNIIADFETKRFRNLSFKLHHYVVQAHFDQIHIMAKFVKKKKKKKMQILKLNVYQLDLKFGWCKFEEAIFS
jgi:hypothetical protein